MPYTDMYDGDWSMWCKLIQIKCDHCVTSVSCDRSSKSRQGALMGENPLTSCFHFYSLS